MCYLDGNVINIEDNNFLSFECDLESKKKVKDIKFYGEWIDKGSLLYRSVVLPLDIRKGIKLYNKSKANRFKR